MAQFFCPGCRLRFMPRTAANLTTCPCCGNPTEWSADSSDALGYKRFDVESSAPSASDLTALRSALAAMQRAQDPR